MHHLPLVALFAAVATASSLRGDNSTNNCANDPNSPDCKATYLQDVCAPGTYSADINLQAPCNMQRDILYECMYGQKANVGKHGLEIPSGKPKSPSIQRDCICQGFYFDVTQGCEDCYQAHGAGQHDVLPSSVLSALSSSYCAATATPTAGIADYQLKFLNKPQYKTLLSSSSGTATSTFSDPIGNKTDVSLYWTAPVSGTAILNVGEFTGTATPTTTDVQNGQIVATAQATGTANTVAQPTGMTQTGSVQSAGTTTTSGGAARQTEAAFAGVLGLVGVVAML